MLRSQFHMSVSLNDMGNFPTHSMYRLDSSTNIHRSVRLSYDAWPKQYYAYFGD